MIIRVFGSSSCKRCAAYLASLNIMDIEYIYIDALADDTQSLCDQYNIDELPVTQIIKQDKTVFNRIGSLDVIALQKKIKELSVGVEFK